MSAEICVELAGEVFDAVRKTATMTSTYPGISVSNERTEAGNGQRIVELYDHLRPSLHAYLCSLGLRQDLSEDVIQETFLRLVRHIVEQGADENLRAWAFRVAHNHSMDLHRSKKRWFRDNETQPHPVLRDRVDPAPNPEQKIIQGERMRQFEDAFARLTRKQRHCVHCTVKRLYAVHSKREPPICVQRSTRKGGYCGPLK